MAINFNELRRETPYKFKPQSVKYGKAVMVSYIDSRDVQDLLDEVCGPENWQDDYRVIDGKVYGGVAINVGTDKNPHWVWKWDCGTESNTEQEKGQASDAFKRAAVKWGVGRFLYRLGIVELPTKEYKGKERPATHDGKILWNNDEISDYIRNGMKQTKKTSNKKYETPKKEPKYNKTSYSEETIKRVTSLEKNGKKGKECLKAHLDDYNKEKDFEIPYKQISELDDAALNDLISYIENLIPQDI